MIKTGSTTLDILFSTLNFLISQGDTTLASFVAVITFIAMIAHSKTSKTKRK